MRQRERAIRVTVVGSLVFDIAVRVERVPSEHETVLASGASTGAGGKGLCQAVAARRLGADVKLIGAVGNDMFGEYLLRVVASEGIDHSGVSSHEAGTHIGIPIISDDGNNRIIGAPRASLHRAAFDIEGNLAALQWADVLLVQNEAPLEAIYDAIRSTPADSLVVWNPAPARYSVQDMVAGSEGREHVWWTPNEAEAAELTGVEVVDIGTGLIAARRLWEAAGSHGVVVTLGAQGAVAIDPEGERHVAPPLPADAVDPTAAGDTFSAALALQLAAGSPVPESLAFASAAGAVTTTGIGAVASIPTAEQVGARAQEASHQ